MIDDRTIEKIAGLFLIIAVAAFSISAYAIIAVDIDRENMDFALNEINSSKELYATSWFANLIGALMLVPAGSALYIIFSNHDKGLALWTLTGLLTASVALIITTGIFFGLYFLADDHAKLGTQHAASLESVARALRFTGNTTWAGGVTLIGTGIIAISLLLIRDQRMPTPLGFWGFISGLAMFLGWTTVTPLPSNLDYIRLYGYYVTSGGGISVLAFLFLMAIWLFVKGTPIRLR